MLASTLGAHILRIAEKRYYPSATSVPVHLDASPGPEPIDSEGELTQTIPHVLPLTTHVHLMTWVSAESNSNLTFICSLY